MITSWIFALASAIFGYDIPAMKCALLSKGTVSCRLFGLDTASVYSGFDRFRITYLEPNESSFSTNFGKHSSSIPFLPSCDSSQALLIGCLDRKDPINIWRPGIQVMAESFAYPLRSRLPGEQITAHLTLLWWQHDTIRLVDTLRRPLLHRGGGQKP